MMTRIASPDHQHTIATSKASHQTITCSKFSQETITTPICKTWKLYDNPYYHSRLHQPQQRKALIWDLNFVKAFMESELEVARAQITELKAELDYERKARRRAESMNKQLSEDLEALEMEYKRVSRESSSEKSEIHVLKREIEEERKMHRLAEVLREERVQMKLADARLFLEEKLSELENTKRAEQEKIKTESMKRSKGENRNRETIKENKSQEDRVRTLARVSSSPAYLSGKERRNSEVRIGNGNQGATAIQQKRSSPEAENPHIKRGIKGFVEFPRVMRAIRSKSGHWGSKIECQRAQLKILLRQKTAPRSSSLVSG